MYYYEVLVSSPRYHKDSSLTYAYPEQLTRGAVVVVELQKRPVLGVITGSVSRPKFKTKDLTPLGLSVSLPEELLKLLEWIKSYYPAPLGQITGLFLPSTLLTASRLEGTTKKQTKVKPHHLPRLTNEQLHAIEIIMNKPGGSTLLHGDTGSGKTRVYIEIATKTLSEGTSALILTPEIGLTTQLVDSFKKSFPERTVLLHSNLTPKERRDRWLAINSSKNPLVVIGPRSALFSPLKAIGLIVMDEAHDTAYKQEQAPHYQTARVASQLANLHKARFIMGSGTPLIQDYFLAQSKGIPIIRMQSQAVQTSPQKRVIEIIDLRNKENLGKSAFISNRLLEATRQTLEKKQQSLIFLNRRGTARLIVCSSCGWQADCPRCDVPLTYHADHHRFTCHTCGFGQPALSSCPQCQSTDIIFKTVGTKAIVSLLQKEFPDARIQRFDTDSKKSESLAENYASLLSGETDILVGTQMIGKGLDLPRLGLVGILAADASLYFPDYTAEERTYQLLAQVIGRVGRGHIEGQAIVQTYSPDNETLKYVVDNDWEGFYRQQLEARRLFMFPPYCHLLKLICAKSNSTNAKSAAEKLFATLKKQDLRVQLVGPSPSFYQKMAGKFRWQITVKAKDRGELLKIIPLLSSGWAYDLDPVNLL